MPINHITIAAEGRHTVFPDEARRRQAVRAIVRVVGPRLVLFAVVDDHIHVVARVADGGGSHLGRDLRFALLPLAATAVARARVFPVEGRSHLLRLVGYILTQPSHHGIPGHPALWTGSCLPDLAGARVLPEFHDGLKEALPRFSRRRLFQAVGLPGDDLEPATDDVIRRAGAARLRDASTSAMAVGPDLVGREQPVVVARAATCRLATEASIGTAEVAHALEAPLRTVQRLIHYPVREEILLAARRRLTLEILADQHPWTAPPEMAGELEPPLYEP